MQIGNQFRCYPTPAQAQTLLQWIGCQRYIYNAKVGEDRYFRTFARKSLQHAGQFAPIDQQYSHFKTDLTPWLSEVPSVVLRNAATLWKQAYARFFQKLAGRPSIQKNVGKQSVWLTSELFRFEPVIDAATGEITEHRLHLGTKKFPVGELAFKAHRAYRVPASLHISIHAVRWTLSFSYDDGVPEPLEKETLDWLQSFTETELRTRTLGLDRGVVLPLAGSDGQQFDCTPTHKQRMQATEKRKLRWQRRMARRSLGGSNWRKVRGKVARYQRYAADVRKNVAHKTSCTLANDPNYALFVFEALKVQNMTRRAKAKQDDSGRWARNGAAAKSGLNKAILASMWGQTKTYLQYKARRQGKLTIEVPAFHSSQACAICGHTHPDNRTSQSMFVCQSCGNVDHADHNAAKVIAWRGVRQVLTKTTVQKTKKRCAITKQKVGAEGSEPVTAKPLLTPGETTVRRRKRHAFNAHKSLNQETPARTLKV